MRTTLLGTRAGRGSSPRWPSCSPPRWSAWSPCGRPRHRAHRQFAGAGWRVAARHGDPLAHRPLPGTVQPRPVGRSRCGSNAGPDTGRLTTITLGPARTAPKLAAGDSIRVDRIQRPPGATARTGAGAERYSFFDYDRRGSMLWLAVAFAVLAIVLARLRGLLALIGFAPEPAAGDQVPRPGDARRDPRRCWWRSSARSPSCSSRSRSPTASARRASPPRWA